MSSVTRLSPFAKTVRVEADIPIAQRDEFERAIVDIIAGECPREPGEVPGRAWARGFMLGVALAPEGWDDLFHNEEEGDLFAIPLVAGEVDPEWPTVPVTPQLADDVLMSLAVGFARSYRHFAAARRANADAQYADALEDEDLDEDDYYPETYVRPEPKVGRNESCPCGSGKKCKKCCGAPDVDAIH